MNVIPALISHLQQHIPELGWDIRPSRNPSVSPRQTLHIAIRRPYNWFSADQNDDFDRRLGSSLAQTITLEVVQFDNIIRLQLLHDGMYTTEGIKFDLLSPSCIDDIVSTTRKFIDSYS